MKKIVIALMMLCTFGTYAENANISTSQYYVDTQANEKQDAVPVHNTNTVMTYDSTSDDGIGTKAIYDMTSSYADQTDALVTASTANAAIQNAINMEFTCANPPKCNLWRMMGLNQTTLPAGYTELEYLESTGTQYIDTGLLATRFVHDIMFTSTGRELMGHTVGHGEYWGSANGGNAYELAYKQITANTQQRRIVEYNSLQQTTTLTTNSQTITDSVELSGFHKYNYHIFHINHNPSNNTQFFSSAKLYDFKAYNANNVLIQHLVPARQNSNGEIGMYDTVTNTFFTNAGTGEFIAGPVASYLPQNQQ